MAATPPAQLLYITLQTLCEIYECDTAVLNPYINPRQIRSDFCSKRQKAKQFVEKKNRKHNRLTGIAFHQLRWQGGEGVGHTCTCLRHAPEASQRHER